MRTKLLSRLFFSRRCFLDSVWQRCRSVMLHGENWISPSSSGTEEQQRFDAIQSLSVSALSQMFTPSFVADDDRPAGSLQYFELPSDMRSNFFSMGISLEAVGSLAAGLFSPCFGCLDSSNVYWNPLLAFLDEEKSATYHSFPSLLVLETGLFIWCYRSDASAPDSTSSFKLRSKVPMKNYVSLPLAFISDVITDMGALLEKSSVAQFQISDSATSESVTRLDDNILDGEVEKQELGLSPEVINLASSSTFSHPSLTVRDGMRDALKQAWIELPSDFTAALSTSSSLSLYAFSREDSHSTASELDPGMRTYVVQYSSKYLCKFLCFLYEANAFLFLTSRSNDSPPFCSFFFS